MNPPRPQAPGNPVYSQQQQQRPNMSQQQQQQKRPIQSTTQAPAPVVDSKSIKRNKPTDKSLPKKVEALVPESKLYTQLQSFEKQLDALLMRKRLEFQEASLKPVSKSKRTVRVFVSNFATDQPHFDNADMGDINIADNRIPSWTLRIEGKLLETISSSRYKNHQWPKFSSFFKSVVVELDRDPELYPEDKKLIAWHKTAGTPETDGFEVKRSGDQNVRCKIILTLDSQPEKYKLLPALSELLGITVDTKANVLMALWMYIKQHKLQDADDKRVVDCDEALRNVFRHQKFLLGYLPNIVDPHLTPLDPIVIDYTIRVDTSVHVSTMAYDIEVDVEDPNTKNKMSSFLLMKTSPEITKLDDQIISTVQQINHSKLKRDFMRSFAKDPVEFMNQWVSSQSRDLEVIMGDQRLNMDEMRKSEFYQQPWVQEGVFLYSNTQAGSRR